MVAGNPLKVTDTFCPASADPMIVVNDPGTTGTCAKLAAFSTMEICGPAGTGGVTVSVIGTSLLPAGPPSMVNVAVNVPVTRPTAVASTRTVPLFIPDVG